MIFTAQWRYNGLLITIIKALKKTIELMSQGFQSVAVIDKNGKA